MGCWGIIAIAAICIVLGQINAPTWAYCVLIPVMMFAPIFGGKSEEKEEKEEPDLDAIRAEIEEEVREEVEEELAELRVRKIDLDARERHLAYREIRASVERPVDKSVDASHLGPTSIKTIRNNLMKLHEARRTDAEYQASDTSKQVTETIQGLNRLLECDKPKPTRRRSGGTGYQANESFND